MRTIIILCFAFCWQVASAQFSRSNFKYSGKVLNTVAFRLQSDGIDTGEIRRIPQDVGVEFPYYISLGSGDLKFVHHEFFRIDPTRYFVREYFKGKFSSGMKVKSFGEELIEKKVSDTIGIDLFDPVCGSYVPFYLAAEHLLKKDGVWTEFENDTESPFFWRGAYRNDRKTGAWRHMLSFDRDTVLIGEMDYQEDSTRRIYVDNGIREKSLANLKELLDGKWSGSSFLDGEGIIRSFKDSSGFQYYEGRCYLNPCQYQFYKALGFIKQLPDQYTGGGKVLNRGKWNLRRKGDRTFIDLICNNGTKWEMELLYYSKKEGLFINLNKHPRSTK